MKKAVAAVIVSLAVGVVALYGVIRYLQAERQYERDILSMQQELSVTQQSLLGYTKYLDYMTVTKKTLSEQMKFLAARVDREYVQVEHIQKSTLGLKSDSTILVKYSVEYSLGYDLRPDSFSVVGDKSGITVTLKKPNLVASPSVNILSYEILSTSFFIDAKTAVIKLQQQLLPIAKKQAIEIQNEEAVQALCEKKLVEFLHDFLLKQPGISSVPVIKVAYKK